MHEFRLTEFDWFNWLPLSYRLEILTTQRIYLNIGTKDFQIKRGLGNYRKRKMWYYKQNANSKIKKLKPRQEELFREAEAYY